MIKKIIIFFLLITFNLYAIMDMPLPKPNFLRERNKLFSQTNIGYPSSKNKQQLTEDDKNIFYYSQNFRVIYGLSYKNSDLTKKLALSILEIAEQVWQKEIQELKFQKPINSDSQFIDIYIGNRNAYNKDSEKSVSIGSNYAGFATFYNNGTPFFVINPIINIPILKVTIAHEFFHTIQYSYFEDSKISDSIWYKNIWFMEATAVMMEDEVFPNNNDYVRFIDDYFNYTYFSLEKYNGSIEYGKGVFARFLVEKYGINLIKQILENYQEQNTFLQTLEQTLNFDEVMQNFAFWIMNKSKFRDGEKFPPLKQYSLNSIPHQLGKYGIAIIQDNNNQKYLISNTPNYLQITKNKETFIVSDLLTKFAIISKDNNLNTNLIKNNLQKPIQLKNGWNLIGNNYKNSINLDKLSLTDETLVYVLRDGNFSIYSPNQSLQNLIKSKYHFTNLIKSTEGAWIFTNKDTEINLLNQKLKALEFNNSINNYQLKAINSCSFDAKILQNKTILFYDNLTNQWQIINNGKSVLNYPLLKTIEQNRAYFIK